MDIYKEEFTRLEREVLRVLFANTSKTLNKRTISKILKVSPTAVSNSIRKLVKKNIVSTKKEKSSREFIIELNKENPKTKELKRVENLNLIYSSGLFQKLSNDFQTETVILFGSYSRGEDNYLSDIDIAIIGTNERELRIKNYEDAFKKKIYIQFFSSFEKIHKELKESLANGIVLQGGFEL